MHYCVCVVGVQKCPWLSVVFSDYTTGPLPCLRCVQGELAAVGGANGGAACAPPAVVRAPGFAARSCRADVGSGSGEVRVDPGKARHAGVLGVGSGVWGGGAAEGGFEDVDDGGCFRAKLGEFVTGCYGGCYSAVIRRKGGGVHWFARDGFGGLCFWRESASCAWSMMSSSESIGVRGSNFTNVLRGREWSK